MSGTTPPPDTSTPTPEPSGVRSIFTNKIALTIIIFSGIVLLLLIVVIWANLGPDPGSGVNNANNSNPFTFKRHDNAKDILNILLPVIGTWMGTILAFYFSKDNFEAANRQAKSLLDQINPTDQTLKDLKVSGVMITPDNGMLLKYKDERDFEATKLSDLIQKLEQTNTERSPIVKSDDMTFLFLIYRTTIERFQLQFEKPGAITTDAAHPLPADKGDLTVAHLLNSNFELIKMIKAIDLNKCFLPITATLSDVRKAMQDNGLCQDVFITNTGKKTEPVLGWITNTMIIEKAQLFQKASTS
jgi:hypothetical protein